MTRKKLSNTRQVITALGGLQEVTRLTGRDYKTVSGWQTNTLIFPPSMYVLMTTALWKAGYVAPDTLWGQEKPVVATNV